MLDQPVSQPSTRDQIADLLKGVAAVVMIQVHLIEQFATLDISESAVGRISLFLGGPPAAPVFLAVMGFFLASSRKSFEQLAKRGALLIVGGLLLNVGLNANLLCSIYQGTLQLDPLAFIFGADILPVAGLSVILIGLVRKLGQDGAIASTSFAALVAAASPLLTVSAEPPSIFAYVIPFFWGDAWWSYFPLFPWLSYALLGYAFAQATTMRKGFSGLNLTARLLFSVAVAAILLVTSSYAVTSITQLHFYHHHGILLFAWIFGFLYLWLMIAIAVEKKLSSTAACRYLKWLGRYVTSAYVFQWLIIGNVATEIFRTQDLTQTLIWFIAILTGVSALVYVFQLAKQRATTSWQKTW